MKSSFKLLISFFLVAVLHAQKTNREIFEADKKAYVEKDRTFRVEATWPVFLARVVKLHPTTPAGAVDQRGVVELEVIKVIHGRVDKGYRLPYVYAKRSLWKRGSPYAHKPRPGWFGDYVWPDLDDLKAPLLLIVVDPQGHDLTITNDPTPKAYAVRVQEVKDENDPRAREIIEKIAKSN